MTKQLKYNRSKLFFIVGAALLINTFSNCHSKPESDPIILVTNDDGYEHENIEFLAMCFKDIGKVVLIAPHENMGGTSNRMTRQEQAVTVKEHDLLAGIPVFSVDATPATTVRWAFQHIKKTYNKKPDVVLSGINSGVNVGASVYYSGTIGAARQGALLGVPSFAISVRNTDADLIGICDFLKPLVFKIAKSGYQTKLFNLNFPKGKITPNTKALQTVVDPNGSFMDYTPLYHPRTKDLYFFPISKLVRKEQPGSDIYEVLQGNISVTPILIEYTSLEKIKFEK